MPSLCLTNPFHIKIITLILEENIKDEMDRIELTIVMNTFFENYDRDINILRRSVSKWS